MKRIFAAIGVINWRTTGSALIAIAGLAVNIQVAWKAKDFMAIIRNSEMVMLNLGLIATAVGLLSAKDSTVTGVGTQAATVNEHGKLVTVDDKIVGTQPPA